MEQTALLTEWARTWAVPHDAMADLAARLGALHQAEVVPVPVSGAYSEAAVMSRVRLAAGKAGVRLFRNNSGAGYDEAGNFMRWGLGNDSKALNGVIKSADLIGIRPRIVQPDDVGKLIGQFVSYEIKHAQWKYCGDDREKAQLAWATLVTSLGGDGRFLTSEHRI